MYEGLCCDVVCHSVSTPELKQCLWSSNVCLGSWIFSEPIQVDKPDHYPMILKTNAARTDRTPLGPAVISPETYARMFALSADDCNRPVPASNSSALVGPRRALQVLVSALVTIVEDVISAVAAKRMFGQILSELM